MCVSLTYIPQTKMLINLYRHFNFGNFRTFVWEKDCMRNFWLINSTFFTSLQVQSLENMSVILQYLV